MAIPYTLIGVGAVLVFMGLNDGEVTTMHNLMKFPGIILVAIGLVWSARVAVKRRQAERIARIQAGLPQSEPLGRGGAAH